MNLEDLKMELTQALAMFKKAPEVTHVTTCDENDNPIGSLHIKGFGLDVYPMNTTVPSIAGPQQCMKIHADILGEYGMESTHVFNTVHDVREFVCSFVARCNAHLDWTR